MPTELADLNERIRQKARADLKAELDAAAKPLERVFSKGPFCLMGLTNAAGKEVGQWEAIDAIKSAAFKAQIKEREQNAIDEFIKKVDDLQEQIDELASSVGGE